VGAPVERLPEGPAVADAAAADERRAFGAWYRRQRELRGISLFYVAARTKLTPERVREIEESHALLDTDGIGRATARTLALAIGADPDEAAAQLGVARRVRLPRRPRFPRLRELSFRFGRRAGLAVVVALGVWLLAAWLSSFAPTASARPHVTKPDYVEKLLHPE
jgi:transcriptional regulator with XRE-family HTH domain